MADGARLTAPGEVAKLLVARDWSDSPLGPPEGWSPSLGTAVAMLLRASAEIVLFWGPEFIALYNDSYAPTIGSKHPRALGRPAQENWAELWDDLGPMLRGVFETGETFSAKDRAFYIERHGYGETVYFDVSYSAVPDTGGTVGGVLCIVCETTDRVLAERRVTQSESRLRALVNATADVIYRMSPDWSEMRELDSRGLVADSHVPRSDWMKDYVPAEDWPMVEARIAKATADVAPYELEHRAFLRDGSLGWMASRAVPIVDAEGKITEWFGTATDVTERHRAEEHLRLVVHELNHRVKNNLAMVQSIASQTFRGAEDLQEAQGRFSERLVALAQANDLLTGERWTGISLHGAIAQAVSPYRRAGDRFMLGGPDISLSPKTALAITLAMHELSTNAVKYGAWSNEEGHVTVEWSRAGDAAGEPRLHIEWREQGGPPVKAPTRRGFGSRLIERGLSGELNGEVRLIFDPAGLRCTVDAPLPAESRS